jgi:hypothetical protein
VTVPRGDQGFEIAPHRLGGERGGGRRRLRAAIVVLVAAVVVAVAWLGPRLADRPNFDVSFFATPRPSATPTPTATDAGPQPTPLPAFFRADGATPAGWITNFGAGLQLLDLGTGTVDHGPDVQAGRDQVYASPDGSGWTCICMIDLPTPNGAVTRGVALVRMAANGAVLDQRQLATLGVASGPEAIQEIQTNLALAADHRSGLLTVGLRDARQWTYSIARMDLEAGTIGRFLNLGAQSLTAPPAPAPSTGPSTTPAPTPNPADTGVNGPYVRRSPDGSRAFVWSTLYWNMPDGPGTSATRAWLVRLDAAGSPVQASAAAVLADLAQICGSFVFSGDRMVASCARYPADPSSSQPPTLSLEVIGEDGSFIGHAILPTTDGYYGEPLVDTRNAKVFLWDAIRLTLLRIDVATLSVEQETYDPLLEKVPGVAAPDGFRASTWQAATSSDQGLFAQLVGTSDGRRLYGLGYAVVPVPDYQAQASLGVFVFDPATLALVDRWAPLAHYAWIEPILGGSYLAIGSDPGIDDRGRTADWQTSLAVHDPSDGRMLVRFGRLDST